MDLTSTKQPPAADLSGNDFVAAATALALGVRERTNNKSGRPPGMQRHAAEAPTS
jgi:hypothetical protein